MRAYATALDAIPMALADNSGVNGIAAMAEVKARQTTENNAWLGIDYMQLGELDMWKQDVYETAASKTNQLRLATQVVKMILKIDDVITVADMSDNM